jgi:hypothetical protein
LYAHMNKKKKENRQYANTHTKKDGWID